MTSHATVPRLHAETYGPVDAPAVLLGPSLGTTLNLWDPQVKALADRWRIVRFDLLGHGRSEVPPGPYTIAELGAEVIALLDELGLACVHYAGISIGGAIGQWLGVHHRERLHSLTIVSSAARFADPSSWPERAARVRAEGTEWLVPSRRGAWITEDFAAANPDTEAWLLAMLRTTPLEGYAACCEAIGAFDIRSRLAEISTPTLVICGEEDPATPVSMAREIADGIPEARLVIVPGASHFANVERPALFTRTLEEHLTATGPVDQPG